MSDPYVWMDPFEEVERAKRHAAQAHDAGRREVMDFIAERNEGQFQRAVHEAVGRMAHRIAEDHVKPHLAKTQGEWEMRKRRMELERDDLRLRTRPVIGAILNETKLGMRPGVSDETMVVSVESMGPIHYHVAMTPMAWR